MKTLYMATASTLLLAGTLFGQAWTDWNHASNDPEIQYRSQALSESKACYLEFRDQQQETGYTTFDAAVDYKSTDLDPENQPTTKTDTEHIVTAPTHTGGARISNCTGVGDVRVSFVQRR
jgi:hypothetical protein